MYSVKDPVKKNKDGRNLKMANVKEYYKEHLVSMKEAAQSIKSGETIWFGSTLCVPYAFLEELADRYDELTDMTLMANMYLVPTRVMTDAKYKDHFHVISMFGNVMERTAQAKGGNIDFWPVAYGKMVQAVTEIYKANVVCVEVCPMDENGKFNTGVLGTNFTPNIMRHPGITKRIAVVNKYQPIATGAESVTQYNVEDFDYIVENDHDIPSLPVTAPTEFDKAIAEHIIPYIHDGDTVQIGMGGLGNQIAYELASKKDLNIFTEIGTDAMIGLGEAGVIKKISMAGSFGTKELYHWLGKRTDLTNLLDVDDVLVPNAVAKQDNIVAINATFQIDITGQACSEAQGPIEYSGVGGSFAFLAGAPEAKNGRSFLCLRSTHPNKSGGQITNIHALLPEGSVVTTPRFLVQYIVTEYGVADVYLRTIKDRIRRIIRIAHPDFREDLKAKAIAAGLMTEEDFNL